MNKAPIIRSPKTRPQRAKMNVRNRLTVANKDPDYVYRIVNDVEDRVEYMKSIGYEVCPAEDVKIGDARVDVGSTVGSAASISVGQGVRAVAMRIPKEWYDEDQANKQAEVDRTEQAMKQQDGLYGSVKVGRGDPSNY